MVTVIIAVPAAIALTKPVLLTVAAAVLLLLHVTVLFVALAGNTVAVSCSVLPAVIVLADLFKLTLVTGCVTVTVQLAV